MQIYIMQCLHLGLRGQRLMSYSYVSEPILSSLYLLCFMHTEIKSLILDVVMRLSTKVLHILPSKSTTFPFTKKKKQHVNWWDFKVFFGRFPSFGVSQARCSSLNAQLMFSSLRLYT